MTSTVETLQAVFENAECKLNVILCKLEGCFAQYEQQQRARGEDDSNLNMAMNPVQLVQDIKQINNDLEKCKYRYSRLQDKKEAIDKDLRNDVEHVQHEFNTALKTVKR